MLRASLAFTIILLSACCADAAISINDIQGKWCGVDGDHTYTFRPRQLLVTFLRDPSGEVTYDIARTESVGSNRLRILWVVKPGEPEDDTWYELSSDKQTLVQLPMSVGHAGPRREYRRC
jgi:hypothetical protein